MSYKSSSADVNVIDAVLKRSTSEQQYRTHLHRILAKHFDKGELQTLCFNLGVDYDNLPAEGKTNKARELVLYLERHNYILELVEIVKESRPEISWGDAPAGVGERIPWDRVKERCIIVSERTLVSMAEKLKLEERNEELYLHRQKIQQHVDSFLSLQDKNYFVLVGNSGMGKSAFLWGLVNQLHGTAYPETACLFCSVDIDLKGKHSIIEAFLKNLADQLGIPPETTLQAIRPSGEQSRLIFIVDAINEFERMQNMEMLLAEFRGLVIHFPWLRLIISCRPHFWTHIKGQIGRLNVASRFFYKPDDSTESFVRVGKLDNEEMALLYAKHRNKFKFEPQNYSDLDLKVQERMRDPLMLRLISEICDGRHVSELQDLLLIDVRAIPKYVEKLREIERLKSKNDEWFLERVLPKLFVSENGVCVNYVVRDCITNLNDQKDREEWLKKLVDGDILKESEAQELSLELAGKDYELILERLVESGILKEYEGGRRLSFSFERFYGCYMGQFLKEIVRQGSELDCKEG